MTRKEYNLILNTIRNAKDSINYIISEDGEKYVDMTKIDDQEISDLFYYLNDCCIKISERLQNGK